jgi:hypothetical protein
MKMLVAFFSGLCMVCPSKAQDNIFRRAMAGFEMGMNISNQQIRRSAENLFNPRNGFRAGVVLEKPSARRLTFLGSLSYVEAGSNNRLNIGETELLQYAEFSFRAKEYVPIGGSDMFLSLGPYFSYGFAGYRKDSNGEIISNNPFNEEEYKSFEWGLGGNIGFKFGWGTYLQLGLQTALSNCYVSEQVSYFNFALMATAGHTINWRNFRAYRK